MVNLTCQGNNVKIKGRMTFDTIAECEQKMKTLALDNQQDLLIDLSQLTEADSSALSLMIEWRSGASRRQQTIQFIAIPPLLKRMAEAYGLTEFLTT